MAQDVSVVNKLAEFCSPISISHAQDWKIALKKNYGRFLGSKENCKNLRSPNFKLFRFCNLMCNLLQITLNYLISYFARDF